MLKEGRIGFGKGRFVIGDDRIDIKLNVFLGRYKRKLGRLRRGGGDC